MYIPDSVEVLQSYSHHPPHEGKGSTTYNCKAEEVYKDCYFVHLVDLKYIDNILGQVWIGKIFSEVT